MTTTKYVCLLLWCCIQLSATAQSNTLYGLLCTPGGGLNTTPGTVRLATIDVATGLLTPVSQSSLATITNINGAALDQNTGNFIFTSGTNIISTDLNSGVATAQAPFNNPLQSGTFTNFRYNSSDSTIYGLAIKSTSVGIGQTLGEIYLSSINPSSGQISLISPQSVGATYTGTGNAIDPHQMVYYYSNGAQIIGLDIYTGLVYSSQTVNFPQGGAYFENYTYNCADTSIYGLIRMQPTGPTTYHFGKINPQTGTVTQISQQALPYTLFSGGGSNTIDPLNGIYYYVVVLPQGGYAVVGISLATGAVVSENPIATPGTALYFHMLRFSSDCAEAAPERLNPNSGSAGITAASVVDVRVNPNPFDDRLMITSDDIMDLCTLRDSQGKIVLQEATLSHHLEFQTAQLKSGIYFLEIQTATGLHLQKLVK